MNWVDRELRRRKRLEATRPAALSASEAEVASALAIQRIGELWERVVHANDALPPPLKLELHQVSGESMGSARSRFVATLLGRSDSGLGFTGEAIRYFWPVKSNGKSFNFWIRWTADRGYIVTRRVDWSGSGVINDEARFNEAATPRILKCLVTGTRVKHRAVRKKRLWFF